MIWNSILKIINNYWREILEVIAVLISIVICCIRKKPVKVIDSLKGVILRILPAVIIVAEQSGKKGADKLELALTLVKDFLKNEMDCGDDVISAHLPFIKEQVEAILETPQKKG